MTTTADSVFPFSKLPRNLEWYRCYDDPARDVWIDGRELTSHPEWTPVQRTRWAFFYRPVRWAVGRPQRKMIRQREMINYLLELQLRRRAIKTLAGAIPAGVLWLFKLWEPGSSSLGGLAFLVMTGLMIWLGFDKVISLLVTRRHGKEIRILQGEIEDLLRQIPRHPSVAEMQTWIEEDLKALERKCLQEIVNAEVDDTTIRDLVRHEPILEPFQCLPILSWGLLQPAETKGPFGTESTGLRKVYGEVGRGLATWRRGSEGQQISRILYVQFIYLLRNNLNICGFFYDCVTRRHYGKRSETFQYNHVTNYSIRVAEIGEHDQMRADLPSQLKESLLDKEINVLSLAVASGANFRCFLVDDNVIDCLNDWLDLNEKYRQIEDEGLDDIAELQKHARGKPLDPRVIQRLREEAEEARSDLLRELSSERSRLEEQGTHIARKALREIRERVESYALGAHSASS